MTSTRQLEADLVRDFAAGLMEHGLRYPDGSVRQGFIVGHEIALEGASSLGNTGSADLLMVTDDGRWWIVEAKLARSAECAPEFLFSNQLARYAASLERIGLSGLHGRLQSFLFGRRSVLKPRADLALALESVTDLLSALNVWLRHIGGEDPGHRAKEMVLRLERQISNRSITLVGLIDAPAESLCRWVASQGHERSLALVSVSSGVPLVACDATRALTDAISDSIPELPAFDLIPQTYKPTPATLPRVLSPTAFEVFSQVVEPRLAQWSGGAWPSVPLSVTTTAAFSLDLESAAGREVCVQLGRAALRAGAGPGEHALKLIVNLIWAADRVHDRSMANANASNADYVAMEGLLQKLCSDAGMLVPGVPRDIPALSNNWWNRVRVKMRGDTQRRPELMAVREVHRRQGYGWDVADLDSDRRLVTVALDAVEQWLGPPPYTFVKRRPSSRRVPGSVATAKE